MLEEARGLFERIEAPEEVRVVDVSIAEASLLAGDLDATLRVTGELLADEEAADLEAEARGLRGFALLRLGDAEQAEAQFRLGAPSGRANETAYGYALNCLGLAAAEVADAAEWTDRGVTVLRQLGATLPQVATEPRRASASRR